MELQIKNLIQNKVIFLQENNIILDFDKINEFDLEIYELFNKKPFKFIEILKEEIKIFSSDAKIKILNINEEINISNIRVKDIGKPVKIDGMVNKVTDPMAIVLNKSFECLTCGTIIKTKGNLPIKCSCGNKKNFVEIGEDLEDIREMVIEELHEKIKGKMPQKIRIRLVGELAKEENNELLRPGKRASIIGVIDKIKQINGKGIEEIYQYRIIALDIKSLEDKFDDTIKPEDMEEIEYISNNNPLEKLTNSLAPNIWGRDEVKKMIVLQMVGGVKKELSDGKFTRDWTNILLIGAPATSKTELAKNVVLRAPGSFYTSGDGSSGVGLTAAVERDEILGNWGVTAGPIVKANNSLLVVDELDKFPKEQLKSLHTPLESGIVKISKAGVDVTFPAETSVLALANPKYGIIEENKQIIDQINLPPALLSRFDIIYILKDEIDKENDDQIVEIIYSNTKKIKEDLIPVQIFRKYISYAKKLNPTLPIEHLKELQEFYHDVRKKSISKDSNMKGLPIGARHLQGIIRLSESSAKIRLSNTVEKEDIELAKKLFYESLVKLGMDECGVIDLTRLGPGKTISQRKVRDFVLEQLRMVLKNDNSIKDSELRIFLKDKGINQDEYDKIINELNKEGTILKNGNEWKLY